MEKRATLISIGISLFSMYLVYQYISGEDARLHELYGTKYVAVRANKDILQFQSIRPTDLEMVKVPNAIKLPGYFNDQSHLYDAVAAVPISEGEFILDNKIISRNAYSGLDSQVGQGRRAISIPVNEKRGVGYLVQPGDRVDLGAHFEFKTKKQKISEVKVFMQDLLVLAAGKTIQKDPPKGVDQRVIRDAMDPDSNSGARAEAEVRDTLNYAKSENEYQTLTVEVTPEQAQQLVYILTVFQDSLVALLRHSDDRQLQRVETVNLDKIMGPESYYVKSKRPGTPPPVRIPLWYDYVNGVARPVYR